MSAKALTDLAAGDVLPEQTYTVTRADLVRYAGASGDQNPIHWSDRVATSVGLPGVVAHGTDCKSASLLHDQRKRRRQRRGGVFTGCHLAAHAGNDQSGCTIRVRASP